MHPVEIGIASTEEIAKQMIERISQTDGFEEMEYKDYEATIDRMTINDEVIYFNDILSKPLTME